MATHSRTLAWKIPWTEEPGRLQFMGSLRVGHDWATSLSLPRIGEGNGNPLQCSCLENPRDGGTWWASIYGVAQVRHDWSDLAAAAVAGINSPTLLLRVRVAILARILQRNRANRMCMCLYSNSLSLCVCIYNVQCIQREKEGERDLRNLLMWLQGTNNHWNSVPEICRVGQQAGISKVCSLESECSLEEGLLPSFSGDFSLCL